MTAAPETTAVEASKTRTEPTAREDISRPSLNGVEEAQVCARSLEAGANARDHRPTKRGQ